MINRDKLKKLINSRNHDIEDLKLIRKVIDTLDFEDIELKYSIKNTLNYKINRLLVKDKDVNELILAVSKAIDIDMIALSQYEIDLAVDDIEGAISAIEDKGIVVDNTVNICVGGIDLVDKTYSYKLKVDKTTKYVRVQYTRKLVPITY